MIIFLYINFNLVVLRDVDYFGWIVDENIRFLFVL